MAKVSGKDLISEITEKAGRRLIIVSSIVAVIKLYKVDLENLSILGAALPAELFDLVSLCIIIYLLYVLLINWTADLAAYKLWFTESNIWSEFNTNIKLDKGFISGGINLLNSLIELEKNNALPKTHQELTEQQLKDFKNFKTNVELYIARLAAAGNNFKALSQFAKFYIWFQAFILPLFFASAALILLFKYGNFSLPI